MLSEQKAPLLASSPVAAAFKAPPSEQVSRHSRATRTTTKKSARHAAIRREQAGIFYHFPGTHKLSWFPPIISKNDWGTVVRDVRAFVAIHSSIIFWIGGYDFLYYGTPTPDGGTHSIFQGSVYREILYITTGLLIMAFTDTVYGMSGIPGGYFPDFCHFSDSLTFTRAFFGLFGSLLIWTGMYTYLDEYAFEYSLKRNVLYYILGSVGLILTNTYFDMAFLFPPGRSTDDVLTPRSKWYIHLWTSLRSFGSLWFQNMIWVGAFNLLEYYCEGSVWRELSYIVGGLFLFAATNMFEPMSWIIVTKDGEQKQVHADLLEADVESPATIMEDIDTHHKLTFAFCGRATVAIFAQVLHNSGVWMIFDDWWAPNVGELRRNLLFAGFGLFFLWITGVLVQNAAITPLMAPVWNTPEVPSEEVIVAVATAAEGVENPIVDPEVLHNAVAIMPSARGRLRRRHHESEWEESQIDRNSSDLVHPIPTIPEEFKAHDSA